MHELSCIEFACFNEPIYFDELWDEPGAVLVTYYPAETDLTYSERLFFVEGL